MTTTSGRRTLRLVSTREGEPPLVKLLLPPFIESLPEGLAASIAAAMADVPVDFGGGCSVLKGLLLASFIVERRMTLAVEIGVYRGRSLVPQALAFAALGSGRVVGIDPYSVAEARQTDDHEASATNLESFAIGTDWDRLYRETSERLARIGPEFGELLRLTSHEAAATFADGSIDMLHVDGNHDAAAVLDDLKCYLPKLSRGAILVMDDASWRSIRPAIELLDESLERLFVFDDRGLGALGTLSDFAVYRMP